MELLTKTEQGILEFFLSTNLNYELDTLVTIINKHSKADKTAHIKSLYEQIKGIQFTEEKLLERLLVCINEQKKESRNVFYVETRDDKIIDKENMFEVIDFVKQTGLRNIKNIFTAPF